MKLFTIDFLENGRWFTYDVDGESVFDAACNLLRGGNIGFKISKITEKE